MVEFILILVYILNGEIVVEQKTYKDPIVCSEDGGRRSDAIAELKGFETGLFAACVQVRNTKV